MTVATVKTRDGSGNRLQALRAFGQSVWYDNISRGLIESGELRRMVVEDGVRGVTSNPTIFQKAIAAGGPYADELEAMARAGRPTQEIYETLAIADIRGAADILHPVWEQSEGRDGFVSLEVSPALAHDTDGTVAEARRLHAAVQRDNLMIKVPATPAGLPAISALIAAGIDVNVTLMFSLEHYTAVADAYLQGLEQRAHQGLPLDRVASVASVFVSRIDTAIDEILARRDDAKSWRGRAAVANSKLIYAEFKKLFSAERFGRLAERGARVQRPLWASTGTKNPAYSDVLYVEALVGPDTVTTLPPATMDAFRDHGAAALRLESGLDEAAALFEQLPRLGVDVDAVMKRLQDDGVAAFAQSFADLLRGIESSAAASAA